MTGALPPLRLPLVFGFGFVVVALLCRLFSSGLPGMRGAARPPDGSRQQRRFASKIAVMVMYAGGGGFIYLLALPACQAARINIPEGFPYELLAGKYHTSITMKSFPPTPAGTFWTINQYCVGSHALC